MPRRWLIQLQHRRGCRSIPLLTFGELELDCSWYIYYGIILALLAIAFLIFGAMAATALDDRSKARRAVQAVAILGIGSVGVAFLVGFILMFVGQCFCLTVPAASKAKGFVATSVMCPVISVLGSCGFITASFHANAADPELLISVMQFTNGVLGTVGFFCFLVFIKRVAQFINRGDMTQNAGNAIGIFVALFVLFYVMVIILIGLFLRRSRCARPQSLFS